MAGSDDRPFWALDPAVVCGLVHDLGQEVRSSPGLRESERDVATWGAVQSALDRAREGMRPARPTDEPPRWLERLVRGRLTALSLRHTWDGSFETIRSLERLGLVELPDDDTYVLAAVSGVGNRFAPREAEALREDPGLREKVVWRMFEVEGGGEVSLANVDKYRAAQNSWQRAFVELTEDGTLPRDRVLSSALAALARDFSAYRAGWFQRLYAALAPTPDEDAERQASLRVLLSSGVPAVAGFALERLRGLSRAGFLDDEPTVTALEPALLCSVKGTAVAAVRLLGDIQRRRPDLAGGVVAVAGTGLGHPHADVQKAAAELLVRLDAGEVVSAAAEELAPAVRAAVLPGRHPTTRDDEHAAPPAPSAEQPTLLIAGGRDVVDRLAALLEDASDALELEMVLPAVAGLTDPAVLAPLRARARKILDRGPHELVREGWLRGRLAALVLTVVGENAPVLRSRRSTDGFLGERLVEVGRSARAPGRTLLLATPDSPAGWLRPETLVRRLSGLTAAPAHHDVVAALLRLHPDGRDEALRAVATRPPRLPEALLRPVRSALGGAPDGSVSAGTGAWWAAASRSRDPLEHDPWLVAQGMVGAGISAPLEAQLGYTSEVHRYQSYYGRAGRYTSWTWTLDVVAGVPGAVDVPTAAQSRVGPDLAGEDLEDMVGWLALTWPHDAEHFLLDGAPPVVEAAVQPEVRHDAVRVLDALLRHEGRTGSLAGAALAAGLSAGRADQRARAVDLALHLAATGRLTGVSLGDALARFAGPATPSRWAGSLTDLAATSRAGRRLVVDALPVALLAMDPSRRGVHELLELLRNELLRDQTPIPPSLVPWLSRFSGSSRAATAARALLLSR